MNSIHDIPKCSVCDNDPSTGLIVVGRGNSSSKIFLIGEAPGASEEKCGLPFVGRSGQLLNKLLITAGIDPERDVYITNILKTRPPRNRTPSKREIAIHIPWLYQQIKAIEPMIIILIGSSALHAILGTNYKITEARGKWHKWKGISVMPIFHPSYILRNPSRLPGRPFDLTSLDLYEVKKKSSDLLLFNKSLKPIS